MSLRHTPDNDWFNLLISNRSTELTMKSPNLYLRRSHQAV
jgi:hypothetical protein